MNIPDEQEQEQELELFEIPFWNITTKNKLKLYGLYMQATVGNNYTKQPYIWNIYGKAHWDAWNLYRGLIKESAKLLYLQLVENLKKVA